MNGHNNNSARSGGGGISISNGGQRKRSRTNSSASLTPPNFRSSIGSNGSRSTSPTPNQQRFVLDKNERLLRLNVGGYPYGKLLKK